MNNKKYNIRKDPIAKLFGVIILATFLIYIVLGTLIEVYKKGALLFCFFAIISVLQVIKKRRLIQNKYQKIIVILMIILMISIGIILLMPIYEIIKTSYN